MRKMSVKQAAWPDRILGLIIAGTLTRRATPCIALDLRNLLNSFCHHGEVGFIPTVISTVLNHSLNVWAQFTYSTPLVQK